MIIAFYTYKVNKNLQDASARNVHSLITESYNNDEPSQVFRLLQPLLMHAEEAVQIVVVSKLLVLVKKYAKTMYKMLRVNQLPTAVYFDGEEKMIPILVVDFTPHLLKFLLQDIILTHQGSADVAYSLSYKLIKTFELNNQVGYKSKMDLSSFILRPLSNFITSSLLLLEPSTPLYEASNQNSARFCYANLTFINLLLQQESKAPELRIRSSKLGLDEELRQKLIGLIQSDQ